MSARLVTPREELTQSFLSLCRESRERGVTAFSLPDPDEFGEWGPTLIRRCLDARNGVGLKPGYVPYSTFWLEENGGVMGVGSVRHTLSESLARVGGHIGYCIRPSAWGKGYGTLQLGLLLAEAGKLGIVRALLTCDADNRASARVMEKNGGVFDGEDHPVVNGVTRHIRRYWIATAR